MISDSIWSQQVWELKDNGAAIGDHRGNAQTRFECSINHGAGLLISQQLWSSRLDSCSLSLSNRTILQTPFVAAHDECLQTCPAARSFTLMKGRSEVSSNPVPCQTEQPAVSQMQAVIVKLQLLLCWGMCCTYAYPNAPKLQLSNFLFGPTRWNIHKI